jgi:hypothetical protein
MKWSDLRYVSDVKEDSNAKEAIQAEGLAGKQVMRNGQIRECAVATERAATTRIRSRACTNPTDLT